MRQTQVTASRQLQILIQSQKGILRWTFNIPQSELHTTASTCQCGASDQESGARFSFPKPKKGSMRLWHHSSEGFRNQQILYDRQLDQRVAKTAFLATKHFGREVRQKIDYVHGQWSNGSLATQWNAQASGPADSNLQMIRVSMTSSKPGRTAYGNILLARWYRLLQNKE